MSRSPAVANDHPSGALLTPRADSYGNKLLRSPNHACTPTVQGRVPGWTWEGQTGQVGHEARTQSCWPFSWTSPEQQRQPSAWKD
jgi:hypothetical protein